MHVTFIIAIATYVGNVAITSYSIAIIYVSLARWASSETYFEL